MHLKQSILQIFLVRASGIEYKFIPRELAEKSAKDLLKASLDMDWLGYETRLRKFRVYKEFAFVLSENLKASGASPFISPF